MTYFVRACLCAALLATGLTCAADDDRSVSFVTDHEKQDGMLVEITTEALRRMHYTVSIRYMPWARALQTVLAGQAEALLGAYHTDERAQKLLYTDSIGSSDILFFKLRSSPIHYERLEDLAGYAIGTVNGAAYTPEFDHATYLRKETAPNYSTNIRKLLIGRVPLIVEKRAVMLKALQEQYPEVADNVVALDKPLTTAKFFNAFSRKYPTAERKVADFNTGLMLITNDGTLQKIMDKKMHE